MAVGTLRKTLYRGEELAAETLRSRVAELDHVIEAKRREMAALAPTSIDLPASDPVPEPSPPPDEGTPPMPAPVPEPYPPPDEATPPIPDPVPEPGPQE